MFEGCGHAELLQVQWSRYSAPCFLNSQLPENDLLVYYMYIYIYTVPDSVHGHARASH